MQFRAMRRLKGSEAPASDPRESWGAKLALHALLRGTAKRKQRLAQLKQGKP